jgi:hypothetical protein
VREARKLSLPVLGSNASTLLLYERHGYRTEGRYLDDLTMAKVLAPAPTS